MSATQETSYDQVPYASHPFAQTHPERLATVATLLGLQPPALERCRVLELGCASGNNLIPMAELLPHAQFLGIDLSEKQVAEGRATIAALGLKNIRLEHRDILDIGSRDGMFDYVVTHGVFSWVPREVQEHIFHICHTQLTPNGVAYISYNTHPGWRMRGTVRDMMLFHSGELSEPEERLRQSLAFVEFMATALAGENTPYSVFLRSELESLKRSDASYIFHEHLEGHNDPIYFFEFHQRAAKHQLRYLGEADMAVMIPANFPPNIQQALERLAHDQLQLEQYMDFLRNRMFRQTLVCHASHQPEYTRIAERLTQTHLACNVRPAGACDLRSNASAEFQFPDNVTISAASPLIKAALLVLGEAWPASVPFARLQSLARGRLQSGPLVDSVTLNNATRELCQTFWQFHAMTSSRLLRLSVQPWAGATTVSARPRTSALTRWQASRGSHATNIRHELVGLTEVERQLLLRLDGQQGHTELLGTLSDLVSTGTLTVQQDGTPITDAQQIRLRLEEALPRQLTALLHAGFLLG